MVSTLLLLGLFVAVVALAALATWTRLPYAILLMLGGLVLGFMPGLPTITLNPDLVLLLFLPPLVYSSACLTSCHSLSLTAPFPRPYSAHYDDQDALDNRILLPLPGG
jgi:monovalent cation/hydrogen antiporter